MSDLVLKVESMIADASAQFVSTLAQYKWDLIPDSQLHAAKQALTKSKFIMGVACDNVEAVHDALIKSAVLGLDLTDGKRQGWLVPRKNQNGKMVIQLQVGYKGVEAIHQRMGVIDRLSIRVIRKNDEFEWSGDDQEKPTHKAKWFDSDVDRGEIIGAFAITYFPGDSINVMVTSISEIYEKHRNASDSWKSYQSKVKEGKQAYPPPWVTYEKAMIEKTMAYIASKQWPANIRNQDASSKILETLHEIDVSDYTWAYSQEQKDAFNELINAEDSLGLYLFQKRVGIESYSELTRGRISKVERGGKIKERKRLDDIVSQGEDVFHIITVYLDSRDSGGVSENVEGCLDITKKMLIARFNDNQKEAFKEVADGL